MARGSLSARRPPSDSTSGPNGTLERTSQSGSIGNVSRDPDGILAELKADDWLASDVDLESIDEPKTSVATGIERQYVMEAEWNRDRVECAHQEIAAKDIELPPLTTDALDAAAALRSQDGALNVYDGVPLGSAATLIGVYLYPTISLAIAQTKLVDEPVSVHERHRVAVPLTGENSFGTLAGRDVGRIDVYVSHRPRTEVLGS